MLSINQEKCIQCNTCVDECFKDALFMTDEKIQHDPDKCIWCGHCLAVCPRDCIIIDGDGYDCEDVEEIGFGKAATLNQIRNMMLIRRSVRQFNDTPVEEDELANILEAAKYSPTGMNRQGNAIIAVTEEKVSELAADSMEAIKRLLEAGQIESERADTFRSICDKYDSEKIDTLYYNAPVVVFVFADSDVDGAICATNMGWLAQVQQLGYCFARLPLIAFNDSVFAEKWGAPEGKTCAIALLIGNPEHEYFCSVPRKNPPVTVF